MKQYHPLEWARQNPFKGPRKHVLNALASHAAPGDKCWPSIDELILSAGIGRRAVMEAAYELDALGWIVRRRRFSQSTEYRLLLKRPPSSPNDPIILDQLKARRRARRQPERDLVEAQLQNLPRNVEKIMRKHMPKS